MAESKAESTELKRTVDKREVLSDPSTSVKKLENMETQIQDACNKNKLEINDSCKKNFKVIELKEQNANVSSDDSCKTEDPTVEKEKHRTEEIILDEELMEIDNVTEKPNEMDNSSVKDKDVKTAASEEEETLNDILKVVHENLSSNNVKQTTVDSKDLKQETNSNAEVFKEKVEAESSKENVVDEITSDDASVIAQIESATSRRDSETKESVEIVEHMEVGIVGPPTTVSELISEEELREESALSTEQKLQDHVAEWVQNSAKAEELVEVEEETSISDVQQEKKNVREKRTRKKKSNDVIALPTRKSQRIISNIIKKSIKCLNKMHAMEGAAGNGKKVDSAEKTREDDTTSRASPKVPQNQQSMSLLESECFLSD
nr:PREDICTED: uncharacterized protein LOC105662030 [Megachile rotundata]